MKQKFIKFIGDKDKKIIVHPRTENDKWREISFIVGDKFLIGEISYNGGMPLEVAMYLKEAYKNFCVIVEEEVKSIEVFNNEINKIIAKFDNELTSAEINSVFLKFVDSETKLKKVFEPSKKNTEEKILKNKKPKYV